MTGERGRRLTTPRSHWILKYVKYSLRVYSWGRSRGCDFAAPPEASAHAVSSTLFHRLCWRPCRISDFRRTRLSQSDCDSAQQWKSGRFKLLSAGRLSFQPRSGMIFHKKYIPTTCISCLRFQSALVVSMSLVFLHMLRPHNCLVMCKAI